MKTTPVYQLLKECCWRSVRQEIFYHTVLQVHKTMKTGAPVYLYNKLTDDGQHQRDRDNVSRQNLVSEEQLRMEGGHVVREYTSISQKLSKTRKF